MTTPDFRALLQELVTSFEQNCSDYIDILDLMDCARAALAEPEGEGPSDEELMQLAMDTRLYRFQATAGDPVQYEMTEQQVHAFARAVLARWGRPAAQP
jgi:hypothetical protein